MAGLVYDSDKVLLNRSRECSPSPRTLPFHPTANARPNYDPEVAPRMALGQRAKGEGDGEPSLLAKKGGLSTSGQRGQHHISGEVGRTHYQITRTRLPAPALAANHS